MVILFDPQFSGEVLPYKSHGLIFVMLYETGIQINVW